MGFAEGSTKIGRQGYFCCCKNKNWLWQETSIIISSEKRSLRMGWRVTNDPLTLRFGKYPVLIDIGAERVIGAERGLDKIAVEIKTFGHFSFITALYEAIGKYVVYRKVLRMQQPERALFLAVPQKIYDRYQQQEIIKELFEEEGIQLVVYNEEIKTIETWIER